jgi:hypothetical protein
MNRGWLIISQSPYQTRAGAGSEKVRESISGIPIMGQMEKTMFMQTANG